MNSLYQLLLNILIDENIIKEDYTAIINQTRKSMIYISLESDRPVNYFEEYDIILKEFILSFKDNKMFIF